MAWIIWWQAGLSIHSGTCIQRPLNTVGGVIERALAAIILAGALIIFSAQQYLQGKYLRLKSMIKFLVRIIAQSCLSYLSNFVRSFYPFTLSLLLKAKHPPEGGCFFKGKRSNK